MFLKYIIIIMCLNSFTVFAGACKTEKLGINKDLVKNSAQIFIIENYKEVDSNKYALLVKEILKGSLEETLVVSAIVSKVTKERLEEINGIESLLKEWLVTNAHSGSYTALEFNSCEKQASFVYGDSIYSIMFISENREIMSIWTVVRGSKLIDILRMEIE